MQLNLDPGFDADLELAHRALDRGWVSREAIESAILEQERTPGSRLLNLLPLTPEQRRRLQSPDAKSVPDEIVEAAQDPARRVDQYILGEHLQSGGMGRICKAWDVKLSRWVALKFLKAVGDERSEAYFEREARLAAQLSHPNIATIYGSGQSGGDRYIAMQFIPGRTLDAWRRGDPLRLAALVRDAARAVAYANGRGIIHRDLKPMNVMVTPEGRVCVLDFGLARPVDSDARHSATGKAMGTPAYMSPEQARGAAVTARSDVYGLGATLYECLTGKPPFTGKTIYDVLRRVEEAAPAKPRKLNPHVPADLETIVLKCLEKDPARRYATAEGLADDLDRFLNHDAITARPSGVVYRTAKLVAKRKAIAIASAASLVLAAVLGWWFLVGSPRAEQLRVEGEHLRLREEAMKLWAEARGLAMAGVDPAGIRRRAKVAREAFDRALQKREDASTLVLKARCLQLEDREKEATAVLDRALALEPQNSEARIELAKALLTEYRILRSFPRQTLMLHPQTLDSTLRSLGLPPETLGQRKLRERGESLLAMGGAPASHAALLKGLVDLGRGLYDAAGLALSAYTHDEPWDAQALWLLGNCLYYAGDPKAAIAVHDRVLRRVPGAAAFWSRGDARSAIGLHDEAIADFTSAIEAEPKFASAFNSRGLAHESKGRFDDAIADYTRASELMPSSPVPFNNRGNAKAMKKMPAEAAADYSRAIELDPGYATAYSNRALVLDDLGRTEEALADFAKALELNPGHASTWHNRGVFHGLRKNLDQAISDYSQAIKFDPTNWRAYSFRGLNRLLKGLNDEAIEDYTKSLEINPNNPEALTNRGRALHLQGRVKEAIVDWKKAMEIAPPDWSGRENVTTVLADHEARRLFKEARDLYLDKHYQRAIDGYRKVIEAFPKSRQAMLSAYNMANIYASLGDKVNALEGLEKALTLGWNDLPHLEKDPAFDSIRTDERYASFVKRVRGE